MIKHYKKNFINYLEKKCNECKLSNKSIGILLRGFHISTPFNLLFVLFFGSLNVCIIMSIILLIIYIIFFIFKGCFLSKLEERICTDDFTIADPFLELYDMKINKKNRNSITYWIGGTYIFLFIFIFILRFYVFN
jgi:hypothetical protein